VPKAAESEGSVASTTVDLASNEQARPGSPTSSLGPITADPYETLSPTGRSILSAAHQVLRQEGFAGLSIGAVAKAAGENKSTVMYHFGDKAGLLTALTDSLVFRLRHDLQPHVEAMASRRPRARALIDVHRRIARDSEYWRTLYDLLPHITRDRRLHARFAALMDYYYEVIMRTLGLYEEGGDNEEAKLVASLFLGVLEGFSMQRLLMGPRGFDLNARFALWESVITPYLESHAAKQSMDQTPAE
jgi:AcrR family transcriptional regulator